MTSDDWSKRWARRIAEAQRLKTVDLKGAAYARVPFDAFAHGRVGAPCRDCGVEHGQLHVPPCGVESCPRCGGQAISCPCHEPGAAGEQ